MNYDLGLCSISFRRNSACEILQAMKEAGLSFIEWGSDVHMPQSDIENAKKIAVIQERYSIKCSSYGTYYKIGANQVSEVLDYIKVAKILGTNVLRLWCGTKNSEDYSPEEKIALFNECKALSKIAEENSVTFSMECHGGTFTNRPEAALELMETVNSMHFRMYWQPDQFRTVQENIAGAKALAPYTVNIHVFNWKGYERFPLCKGIEIWRQYLANFKGEHTLLLEFMPDNKLETLSDEAATLKELEK